VVDATWATCVWAKVPSNAGGLRGLQLLPGFEGSSIRPDLERFPQFARATLVEVEHHPEILFMPAFWWHVVSEDENVAVNFGWNLLAGGSSPTWAALFQASAMPSKRCRQSGASTSDVSPTSLSFPDSRRASNRGYVRDGSLVDIGNRWLFVDIVLTAASPGLDPNRGLPGSLHGTFPHGADRRCALHRRCD
jgi:hypothetical protein